MIILIAIIFALFIDNCYCYVYIIPDGQTRPVCITPEGFAGQIKIVRKRRIYERERIDR